MLKAKIIGGIVALSMVLPLAASAATIPNISFPNGDVKAEGVGGASTNATVRIDVPALQVVEAYCTDVLGDLLPVSLPTFVNFGEGPHDISVPLKFPVNEGYFTVEVRTAGIFGPNTAVSCTDAGAVVSSATFSNALRTIPSSGSTVVGGSLIPEWFTLWWNANKPAPAPVAPVVSAKCQALTSKLVGTQVGAKNSANGKLQGFLLGEGASIPLLENNQAPFGFYGTQTASAVNWYQAVNNCA